MEQAGLMRIFFSMLRVTKGTARLKEPPRISNAYLFYQYKSIQKEVHRNIAESKREVKGSTWDLLFAQSKRLFAIWSRIKKTLFQERANSNPSILAVHKAQER